MKNLILSIIGGLLMSASFSSHAANFTLESSAFAANGMIPKKYTCEDQNISPPLSWSNIPENTLSFALIVDDPDAPVGVWDHWILFNIPASTKHFDENVTAFPEGTVAGSNSYSETIYKGPCPPSGTHRYFFKLYALNVVLELKKGAKKDDLENAMKGHILGEAVLIGKYAKQK